MSRGTSGESHGRNARSVAPIENVVQLLRARTIAFAKFGEPALLGMATVAIEDDAHVPRYGQARHLLQQVTFIELIKQPAHRCLSNPTPESLFG